MLLWAALGYEKRRQRGWTTRGQECGANGTPFPREEWGIVCSLTSPNPRALVLRFLKSSLPGLCSLPEAQQFPLSGEMRGCLSFFKPLSRSPAFPWLKLGGRVKHPVPLTRPPISSITPFNELWSQLIEEVWGAGGVPKGRVATSESILWDMSRSSSSEHVSYYQLLSSALGLSVFLRETGKVHSTLLHIHLFTMNWASVIHQALCCVLGMMRGWGEGYKIELTITLNPREALSSPGREARGCTHAHTHAHTHFCKDYKKHRCQRL